MLRKLAFRRRLARIAARCYPVAASTPAHPAIQRQQPLFRHAPFRECHAATLTAGQGKLNAAWFGGSTEGCADVDIWGSYNAGDGWSTPQPLTRDPQPAWNPVLFRPANGPLQLYYKLGPNPHDWWGLRRESSDNGRSWGEPQQLPDGIYGPIKNKPLQLADGTLLSPSSEEHHGWHVHIERSSDNGHHWQRSAVVPGDGIRAIQPSLLQHADGRLQMLCRSKQGRIASSWSEDHGRSWNDLKLLSLPNPNSGTDALTLADGRQLLVYNPSTRFRFPLSVALSNDGLRWSRILELERGFGEYSYPAVVQDQHTGLLHIVYSWNLCHIKHVVLDPHRL